MFLQHCYRTPTSYYFQQILRGNTNAAVLSTGSKNFAAVIQGILRERICLIKSNLIKQLCS